METPVREFPKKLTWHTKEIWLILRTLSYENFRLTQHMSLVCNVNFSGDSCPGISGNIQLYCSHTHTHTHTNTHTHHNSSEILVREFPVNKTNFLVCNGKFSVVSRTRKSRNLVYQKRTMCVYVYVNIVYKRHMVNLSEILVRESPVN